MKKKTSIVVTAFAALALGLSAFAPKADCPNGCLDNGNGCWCHQWYPCYREAGGGIVVA